MKEMRYWLTTFIDMCGQQMLGKEQLLLTHQLNDNNALKLLVNLPLLEFPL